MKKLLFALVMTSVLVACKKETTTPNTSGNNTTDTTKTSNDVSISGFDCAGVQISGTLIKDKAANNVTATLTYTGGNGKTYLTKSHTSTGVTGLSATLLAGTLENGKGTLVYTISGTPSSAGTAGFAISLGGKSCTITISIDEAPKLLVKVGSNITDSEGNSYKTVTIGTQTWMAENLKVSKYNDGTPIQNVAQDYSWSQLETGAWVFYKNDSTYNLKYGKLYNWYAVSPKTNGNKNVCPTGWHVPTDAEWTVLTDYLGGEKIAGGKMKEVGISNWDSPNTAATNISLFNGLPGGYRAAFGVYSAIRLRSSWWSSTITDYRAWSRDLDYFSNEIFRYEEYLNCGHSIRCIKD